MKKIPPSPGKETKGTHGQGNNSEEVFKDLDFYPYYPGIEDVVQYILRNDSVKTIRERDTDREAMYLYDRPKYGLKRKLSNPKTAGIYVPGESFLKSRSENAFMFLLSEMSNKIDEWMEKAEDEKAIENLKALQDRINRKMQHDGIKNGEIQEILQSIRRKTFVDAKEMNPPSFIPLKERLLNLRTFEQEEFNPAHFFIWKVQGTYDPEIKELNQVPEFEKFLTDAYRPESIPTILDYMGYCLHPAFPRQKILVILGPPRMGKGTLSGIIERAIPEGYGRFSLMKLLIPENKFSLQGVEGKNLLIDREIKRNLKKGADFDVINSLFGGDPLPLEKKFKAEVTYTSRAKGILIGNLPVFFVDNMAFLSRLLIVLTKSERAGPEIPDLADRIWISDGDRIVALLLNRLKSLMSRNFNFSNEKTLDETAKLWDNLADSVSTFVEKETDFEQGQYIQVDDAYKYYLEYCEGESIPPEKEQQFKFRFGKHYQKKRKKENGSLFYVFEGCVMVIRPETEKTKPESSTQRHYNGDDDLDDILG